MSARRRARPYVPPTVVIDGEVVIPRGTLIDLLSRVDDLLELLLKVEASQLEVLKTISRLPPIEVPPTIVEMAKVNRYDVARFDLSKARSDEPVGLIEKNRVASFMSWERVDAAVTYKLNSVRYEPLTASVGVEHQNWEIEEIFISNAAAPGKTAVLYYEWREE